MTMARKLTKKKESELRLIADATYDAILATGARARKVSEKN
jgi:hypothetical protein